MSTVNESALRLLLSPVSQCQTIGSEQGLFPRDGIGHATSAQGSVRYVYSVAGRQVSALQVMVGNGRAVATNVYTDPEFRRNGLAAQLIRLARINHPSMEFSEERSEDGEALVKALLAQPIKRMSNKALASTLRRMVTEAPDELQGALFNWNESELGPDKDCILRHPGRDGRYSRGANGGKEIVKIADFLAWLRSDAPLDPQKYGPRIDPEWRYQICRLRHLAGIRAETYYEALLGVGLARLPNGHPRNYTFADGSMLPTLERDGLRVSMSSGTELYEEDGRVMAGSSGDQSCWSINALLVDPSRRRQGLATRAMREITQLADQFGITLHLEATPIDDKPLGRDELSAFYAKFGFAGGRVKTRMPGARPGDLPQDLLDWAAGSKVVDEQGAPLVVYHGTKGDIRELRPSRGGEYGTGIYLTPDPSTAWKYAEWAKGTGAPNIIPVYASIKNPLMTDEREKVRALGPSRIKAMGHDGIVATGPNGDRQYIVFSPDQLRSTFAEVDIERERMRA